MFVVSSIITRNAIPVEVVVIHCPSGVAVGTAVVVVLQWGLQWWWCCSAWGLQWWWCCSGDCSGGRVAVGTAVVVVLQWGLQFRLASLPNLPSLQISLTPQ